MGEEDHDAADDASEWLEVEQLKKLHAKIDANIDGYLDLAEMMSFAHHTGKQIADQDIRSVFVELDTSKDGKLSLEEHLADILAGPEDQKELEQRKSHETEKFQAADANGDGHLNADEISALFYPEVHEGVLTIATKQAMVDRDANGDGKLDEKEFEELHVEEGSEPAGAFHKLDLNKDGFLDVQELRHWESGRFNTEEAFMHLFAVVDTNHDNRVSFEELTAKAEQIATTDAHHHLQEWSDHYEL